MSGTARGYIGIGTKLEYSTDSGSTWVAVARLTEIGDIPVGGEADDVEVTGYDTTGGFREKIKGLKDAGELDLTGVWTAHASQQAIMEQDDVIGWRITLPNSLGVWTADGYINDFSINPQLDDRIEWSGTLVISGAPALVVS